MTSDTHTSPHEQLSFTFDDRHWRVRGLEKQLSCERLKVNLLVERRELVHVDTLDLYAARLRKMFVKEAAAELFVEEATIKQDLGRVLCELEARQETLIRAQLTRHTPEAPRMSEAQRNDALELLHDPQLVERILADYQRCGLVGEQTNKLICYLACTSRHLPRPLSVLIQSSSASGKTSLVDATLAFMPAEQQIRLSALTGQSLYYMGRTELKHKILAVAEEEGVSEAAYALKLLQSDARLAIASAGKDSDTGRQQTQHYEVEGPVAMLLTTTAEEPDAELSNRCLVLSVNEQAAQTAAIHQRQRAAYALRGIEADVHAVQQRHQHAQRLLEPLAVILPWAEQLTFRSDQTRMRRDHAKYLALIASLTLLHQYQRRQFTRTRGGQTERCVMAALDDVQWANRLVSEALGARFDALLPHTRELLDRLDAHIAQRAEAEGVARGEVRFTQRELREALTWSDRAVRRQLTRLVELEYVLAYRTGRGNQRVYQLLYDGRAPGHTPLLLGLADPQRLEARGSDEIGSQEQATSREEATSQEETPSQDEALSQEEAPSQEEAGAQQDASFPAPSTSLHSESGDTSPPKGTEPAVGPFEPAAMRRASGGHPAAPQNGVKSRRRKHFPSKPAV